MKFQVLVFFLISAISITNGQTPAVTPAPAIPVIPVAPVTQPQTPAPQIVTPPVTQPTLAPTEAITTTTAQILAETTTTAEEKCRAFHAIVQGDTLNDLAKKNNVGVEELFRANPTVEERNLRVGHLLCIPK